MLSSQSERRGLEVTSLVQPRAVRRQVHASKQRVLHKVQVLPLQELRAGKGWQLCCWVC